ncbi:MAG: hypothetical protein A2W91_08855 [Bacteroidetes bacterium GWF2_38_335]|nr:MAG: hypothetical protein A2W91_08855 [Bacteroidetes bacterium GWF2_38_335]OFY80481.1 MAG: hypothetical protein A2281_08580 [Bacteroidetes bacterium RIFOXYA12_FULL_38_20]HBS85910.1 hypothetical protein [Bacteroidales bacterium]
MIIICLPVLSAGMQRTALQNGYYLFLTMIRAIVHITIYFKLRCKSTYFFYAMKKNADFNQDHADA